MLCLDAEYFRVTQRGCFFFPFFSQAYLPNTYLAEYLIFLKYHLERCFEIYGSYYILTCLCVYEEYLPAPEQVGEQEIIYFILYF